MRNSKASERPVAMHQVISVWGLALSRITRAEAVDAVSRMVREGRPSYFITASTHYAMLSSQEPRLKEINDRAAFIVADGAPLVWASKLAGMPLPERVAGSDMIFDLCEMSAREGFRVFLLGAPPGVAESAARNLVERYPGLIIAGTECPPFRDLSPEEHAGLIDCCVRRGLARHPVPGLRPAQGGVLAERQPRSAGSAGLGADRSVARLRRPGRVQRGIPKVLQKLGFEWGLPRCGWSPPGSRLPTPGTPSSCSGWFQPRLGWARSPAGGRLRLVLPRPQPLAISSPRPT